MEDLKSSHHSLPNDDNVNNAKYLVQHFSDFIVLYVP